MLAARRVACRVVAASRMMSIKTVGGKGTPLGAREVAAEAVYFNEQEERLLKQLLNKVKKERAVTDAPAVAAATSVEAQRLESIVGKYKVSPEDIAALIAWRHSHDF